MRYFRLEPGSSTIDDGDGESVAELLEGISEQLVELGARKALLIVEDAAGVTIAVGRAPGVDDTPKETTDLLLRVALDAKELMT